MPCRPSDLITSPVRKMERGYTKNGQGALGRQIRGAWDLTLANAWGVLAMEKFPIDLNRFQSPYDPGDSVKADATVD